MCEQHSDRVACESYRRLSRRGFVAASGLSLGLAANPWTALAETLHVNGEKKVESQVQSVIIVWLQGGPSQLETFDPHPGTMIGGDVKGVASSIQGVQLADSMPKVAEKLHLTTLIRSMVSKEGDHERATINFKTGWRPEPTLEHPSIGAILTHKSNRSIDLPQHISILPSQAPSRGGFLGPQYDAFTMYDPKDSLPNLVGHVDENRRAKRLDIMTNVADAEFQRGRLKNLDANRLQQSHTANRAISMMDTEQLKAFDLHREDRALRTAFGDNPFGRGCLAAVRLVEQGVRCIEIELNGWDSHIDNHNLQYARAKELDDALSSMIQTLKDRELLDKTIVLCSGEFGRTPKINPAGGRDHWPSGFSTLLAGGPFRQGYVHGATNPAASESYDDIEKLVVDPVTIPDLHATVLRACGIDPAEETQTPIGRPIVWSEGRIRNELFA